MPILAISSYGGGGLGGNLTYLQPIYPTAAFTAPDTFGPKPTMVVHKESRYG